MITERLGVSKSTMSYWFKDKPFKPNQEVLKRVQYGPVKSGAIRHEKKIRDIASQHELGKHEIGILSKRDLWMLGLGLYIGEGSKTIEGIRVSNSDPIVIATIIRWLKEMCGLSADNITIRIHIYPDTDEIKAKKYWKSVTGLSYKNFRKTIIDTRINKKASKRGKLPHGAAHISVICRGDPSKGVMLYRKIDGWVAGAMGNL